MTAHSASEPERDRTKKARPSDPRRLSDVVAGGRLLFTPEEAATVLRIGRTTVYALMKAGELHPVHIGRSCRLSRADLERYVRRLESPPPSRTRPRRRGPTITNQRGLFDLSSDPVDPA
ncbi:MAG TPA: helix-turn-helix domain-containing protein [Pedococcus sp.]|jgi:excisionase family DNA binding protein|nr:helix-turn-helix domain-containing protein [Pedococcus sp.]